jgi:hypothetical protein
MARTASPHRSGSGALALAFGLVACASGSSFKSLDSAEQEQFHRCSPAIAEQLCRDPESRAECLRAKAAVFARRAPGARREWLEARGCPASSIDGASVAAKEEPPAPAAEEAPAPVAEEAPPPLETPPAPVVVAAAPEAGTGLGLACKRSAECESDLCVRGTCVALGWLETGRPCREGEPLVAKATPAPAPPAEAPASARRVLRDRGEPGPRAPAGGPGEQQLREAIVTHEADMKRCVERQLKLVPTLKAEGTLVIEVDPRGHVASADLKGQQLEGTALEGCLRTLASRWRFPRTAQAYAIEAPLKVSGVE